ncbi:C6 transcription factor [Pseudozyma hubeiensis SY62]|uniref:C6 transcription factor n=1 Tax=Pseudozyma hubeiensis (strain SY62) TaxID=1305764 RepID=R9P5N8_PSEHS|nr:C6 transcription factor [Pseudozyma hubeiensis SY62]GAC93400.1 C6 transcription factor [Pseudozyma hubeiensis SY62]
MADKPRGLQVAAYRYNCQPCKQRKTKCDRVKPCASCHLRGTQDKCYAEEHDVATSPTSSATRAARPHKKARFSEADAIAGSTSRLPFHTPSPQKASPSGPAAMTPVASTSSLAQERTSAIQDHIALLRSTIDQLEASILPGSGSGKHPSSHYNDMEPTSDLVLTTEPRVVWADVAHLFPPKRDVERILEYFLNEMVYIMIPVQGKQFWRAWLRLSQPSARGSPAWRDRDHDVEPEPPGISRSMVASLLMCLASTSFLIPQAREHELELTFGMAEQRDHWITCALALARCGISFHRIGTADQQQQPLMHYVDSTLDTSLDRFGFDTLACRVFSLIGMSEMAYQVNGECLRRAVRINLFDETSPKAAELFTVDDDELTDEEILHMRRRIGIQAVVTERWTCLYTGRQPMIDEDAETLPTPAASEWSEIEDLTLLFSRFVSKLRRLPAQLASLTSRKPGDWSSQRARDQEAVQLILDIDRGLCSVYDPSLPRASTGGRSSSQILAELPEILERNQHLSMSDAQLNQMHRDFANALIMTSSWLSLRCLVTSNLMFVPWVSDVASRYCALNLARRLIELLPSIWMMTSSPYVPFSSSWISRHLFLACTVLSVPILGQESASASSTQAYVDKQGSSHEDGARTGESAGDATSSDRPSDFAPSRMQSKQIFSKLSSKILDGNSTSKRLPASSSVDLDWFSGKLVEIASLFSKLAERGDQTAGVNTKLIDMLLNGRAELRDRVLLKCGQKQNRALNMQLVNGGMGRDGGGSGSMGRIESQRDLTTFVSAASAGKSSPSSTGTSPAVNAGAGSPSNSRSGGVGGAATESGYGRTSKPGRSNARKDFLTTNTREQLASETHRVQSPSLHDLANAVDTFTSSNHTTTHASSTVNTPPLPSFSPHPSYLHHQQHSTNSNTATSAGGGGIGWDWDKTFFPSPTPGNGAASISGNSSSGGGDVLANVPLLLDTQDWLAILDGVDIPL